MSGLECGRGGGESSRSQQGYIPGHLCPPFIDLCPFEVPVKDQRESNLPNMGQSEVEVSTPEIVITQ